MRTALRQQVENKHRQRIARALEASGPVTARGVAADAERSVAWATYHLRVLSISGAVTPFLSGVASGDDVAYALTPENLPESARDLLLGELSLQTCMRLMGHLLAEDSLSTRELADRMGLSLREAARYVTAMRAKNWLEDTPQFEIADQADRLRDFPEWITRFLDRVEQQDADRKPGEDGTE